MAALVAALIAVVGAVIVLLPEPDSSGLPDPLEDVFPLPEDAVVRQTVVQVDLPIGYEARLTVDGVLIPAFEVGWVEETGVFTWQPTPGGVIDMWVPGEHTVEVSWDTVEGNRPDPGSFSWSFRVI